MYDAIDDPYCYAGTTVLINKLGIRDAAKLEAFEEEITRERAAQPLPEGRLSVAHYLSMHRFLFQDVYRWAGRPRTVRPSRGDSMFAFPEHIDSALRSLFRRLKEAAYLNGLNHEAFAKGAAGFLAELNHIHAFRDGNGRAQLAFVALLASKARHPLRLERLDPPQFLAAMIESFHGREDKLERQFSNLVEPGKPSACSRREGH